MEIAAIAAHMRKKSKEKKKNEQMNK